MWCVYIRRSTPEQPFSFSDLTALQEQVLTEFKTASQPKQAMIFAEVSPTVTLGARQVHDETQRAHLAHLEEMLKAKDIAIEAGLRGGKETWHGPGQWVGFVVTPLECFTGDPKGVRKAVHGILERVREAILPIEPEARIEEGDRLGVWSDRGKLVSVGIRIREGWITSGFALNCIPHETSFFGIDPCGLPRAKPDFLFEGRLNPSRFADEFSRMPFRLISMF